MNRYTLQVVAGWTGFTGGQSEKLYADPQYNKMEIAIRKLIENVRVITQDWKVDEMLSY